MSRLFRLCAAAIAVGLTVSVVSPSPSAAATASQQFAGRTTNGQWVLDVPETFNGTLLLWSHGYTFEPVPASNAPTAAVRDALLDRGYALIGSSYAKGGAGWAVREGVRAGIEAIGIAERKIGARRVGNVFAWGNSLGGLITQTLAERRPGLVDGVAPLCGVLAGTNRNLDLALDMAVGVKHFFYPKLRLRGYSSRAVAEDNFAAASAEVLKQLSDPATQASATGRMLALAALMDASAKTKSYDGNGMSSSVRGATESVLTALNYGTLGRYDIEKRVGGNPSTNARTDYTARVTRDAAERFTTFGFGSGLLKSFAQSLQTHGKRVQADPAARRAADRLGNPTGDLSDRTITMHTVFDPLVLVQNERVFAQRVGRSDDGRRLIQLYVRPPATYASAAPYGAGHCNFTADQYVATIRALDSWVTSGDRPSTALLTQLFAAHPGALDLDYQPDRWPAR